MISLEIPADLRALRIVGPWMRAALEYGDEPDVDNVAPRCALALQEVCVNVVEHAYGGSPDGRIVLDYEPESTSHNFTVRDTGVPFDAASRPEVDLDKPTEHGYGLHIAESLCDSLAYERMSNENSWRLVVCRSAQLSG